MDMTEKDRSQPADLYRLLQEIKNLNWWNTSEQKLKEGYKILAETYDKVRNNQLYSDIMLG